MLWRRLRAISSKADLGPREQAPRAVLARAWRAHAECACAHVSVHGARMACAWRVHLHAHAHAQRVSMCVCTWMVPAACPPASAQKPGVITREHMRDN